jgi:hypothetical protein
MGQIILGTRLGGTESSTGSRHRQPGFFHDEFGIRWRVKWRPRIRRGVWLIHINFGCYEVPWCFCMWRKICPEALKM